MDKLKTYLTKHNIPWRKLSEWALIFSGNHAEGIIIEDNLVNHPAAMSYIKKLGLYHEYRGFEYHVYVAPEKA